MTQASGEALLRVDHVSVRFGGLTAVDNVSFDVHEGELLGLIGPNGAGKTTMLRAITGVVTASEGNVYLRGGPLVHLSIDQRVRRGLSLSQQLVKPLRTMTLVENVALTAGFAKTASPLRSLLNVASDAEMATGMEMLARVGIAERAHQLPSTQPLGVLKRLELARALALQP